MSIKYYLNNFLRFILIQWLFPLKISYNFKYSRNPVFLAYVYWRHHRITLGFQLVLKVLKVQIVAEPVFQIRGQQIIAWG